MATGSNKQKVVSEAIHGGHSPIGLVASIVGTHEGNVAWFVDKAAAPKP
jgi:6-phosphogluconolactonase/glucosamine-6-phosphate isomerase/deaminase